MRRKTTVTLLPALCFLFTDPFVKGSSHKHTCHFLHCDLEHMACYVFPRHDSLLTSVLTSSWWCCCKQGQGLPTCQHVAQNICLQHDVMLRVDEKCNYRHKAWLSEGLLHLFSFFRLPSPVWDVIGLVVHRGWRSMVKHQPLQVYEKQVFVSFVTGIYGCRWKRYQRSQDDSSRVRQ